MTRSVAICSLVVSAALVFAFSILTPETLGDKNTFLKAFMNDQLLNVLGIIVTITLASAGSLHLTFNAMEENRGERFLYRTRAHLRQAAFWLIWLFLAAIGLVVIKPFSSAYPVAASFLNGTGLFILLWNVLLSVEIIQTIFALQPDMDGHGRNPVR